jgi:hypothetical protein
VGVLDEAALELGDERSRDPGTGCHIGLAELRADPNRPDRLTKTNRIHRRRSSAQPLTA